MDEIRAVPDARIDAVGMQSHVSIDYPAVRGGSNSYEAAVKKFIEKDIDVQVTELDIANGSKTYSPIMLKEFDADRVPVFTTRIDHGVIAPSYVAMKLTKYPYFDEILKDLVTDSSQKDLSMLSKLGPVSSRSQAYDRQADDVRFLAASCKDGPLPALGDAVFQTNPEAAHKFAEEIRTYLRLGVLKNQ